MHRNIRCVLLNTHFEIAFLIRESPRMWYHSIVRAQWARLNLKTSKLNEQLILHWISK